MARKRTNEAKVETRVSTFEVPGSRPLVTVPEDAELWDEKLELRPGFLESPGSIVRVRPPPDASDSRVEEVRRAITGTAALRVMPRRRKQVVVKRVHAKQRGARAIAMQLVDEANTVDRDALRVVVDEALSGAGL